MKKKIVFLVPSLAMGGMERVCVNYANLFNRRGYEVTVLNFTSDDEAIVSGFDKDIKYQKRYNPVPNILRAKFKDILRLNFRILPWGKWIRFHSAKYLYKKYIRENFDIEVAFFGIPSLKILSNSTNATAKTIGWLHSVNVEQDIKNFGYKKVKRIYNDIENLVCVSSLAKDKVIEFFDRENNIFVVNNPNDTVRIRTKSEEKCDFNKTKFTFVNVSRLSEIHKGFIRLFSVCKRLVDDGYNFDIVVVGDGQDRDIIKGKVEELKLNNVIFMGQQSNPYKYMKLADMYICSSYIEGFSMTMMEAIILGLPILTTEVSGARDMLGDSEYGLIVENSEEGLYKGMKEILSNKDLYNHYVKKAIERKDYLSEDKIMDKLEGIING